jgi:D-amino peptidase
MKVLISCDIEGISGVVNSPEHTSPGERDYERFRRLMTAEANAAVEGALAGGATEVVINDSHGPMTNLIIEDLNPASQLITGRIKSFGMMQGIGPDVDKVMFVGYHASAGTAAGVLAHTIHGRAVTDLYINGQRVGETGLNAAIAGAFNVPVVMVAGDNAVTEEAKALLGPIETVATKQGVTQKAAQSLHPKVAQERIKEAARRAMALKGKPLVFPSPVTVKVALMFPGQADVAELCPGVIRLDGRTIEWTGRDMVEASRALRAILVLAGTAM